MGPEVILSLALQLTEYGVDKVTQSNAQKEFESRQSMASQPVTYKKIGVGMSKKQLLDSFGPPLSLRHDLDGALREVTVLYFNGKMCQYEGLSCFVKIYENKISMYYDVRPEFTDEI